MINAEEYYRSMFRGGVQSWNLRDQHMDETHAVEPLERTSQCDEGELPETHPLGV